MVRLLPLLFLLGCATLEPTEIPTNIWQLIGTMGGGSAFPVAYENGELIFLTCGHVLEYSEDGTWIARHASGEYLYHGRVLSRHEKADLSLIAFKSDPRPVVRLGPPPRWGEELFGVGFTEVTLGMWVKSGHFSEGSNWSGFTSPGDSGGFICRRNGEVVGVMSGYWDPEKTMSIIIVLHPFRDWVYR